MQMARRRIAQFLWWVALTLLAAGIAAFFAPLPLPPSPLIGGSLAALGLNIMLGGDLVVGRRPRVFSARGAAVRGHFSTAAGLADLEVAAGPNDRVARVEYGPVGRPRFDVTDGVATLHLKNARLSPSISRWQASLARNILWDLNVRSSVGDIHLNLSDLRLEKINARTTVGRIYVICPARGYVQMDLRTTAGEIVVKVPQGIGAEITVTRGTLGTINQQNDSLLAPASNRYVTPGFDTADSQVIITISGGSGDVFLT